MVQCQAKKPETPPAFLPGVGLTLGWMLGLTLQPRERGSVLIGHVGQLAVNGGPEPLRGKPRERGWRKT
jgi:hypothetical protein